MPEAPAERRWWRALGHDYTHGNTVTPYIGGRDALQGIYNAINTTHGPSDFIYILAWWLDLDVPLATVNGKPDPQSTLRVLLQQKAKAKVQIRVMMWSNWGKVYMPHDSPGDIKALVDNGVDDLGAFYAAMLDRLAKNPDLDPTPYLFPGTGKNSPWAISNWINGLPNDAASIVDWLTATVYSSHHQKLVCVRGNEGLIGLCGGVDVNRDRIAVVEPGKGQPLHDVHCQVRGPAAADLVHVFVQRWDAHPYAVFNDPPRGKRLMGRDVPVGSDVPTISGQIVRVCTTFNRVNPGDLVRPTRTSCALERSTEEALLVAIASATRFIYVEDQYLTSLTIADALAAAAKNVKFVIALITSGYISDLPQAWSRRKAFIDHAEKGLGKNFHVFYLVDPDHSGDQQQNTYVHAKTWIFDDELAYIGSANVNNRGLNSDSEVGVLVCDKASSVKTPGFAKTLRRNLWQQHLGVDVPDGFTGLSAWTSAPKPQSKTTNRVMPYIPDAEEDSGKSKAIPWEFIDPDLSTLQQCSMGVRRVRQLLRKAFGS